MKRNAPPPGLPKSVPLVCQKTSRKPTPGPFPSHCNPLTKPRVCFPSDSQRRACRHPWLGPGRPWPVFPLWDRLWEQAGGFWVQYLPASPSGVPLCAQGSLLIGSCSRHCSKAKNYYLGLRLKGKQRGESQMCTNKSGFQWTHAKPRSPFLSICFFRPSDLSQASMSDLL